MTGPDTSRRRNIALFVPHLGCPHRCSFCDQERISGSAAPVTPEEVTATCRQAVENLGAGAKTAELAFFGGSFTAIPRAYMRSLLEAARPFVESGAIHGVRLSTRPDAIDGEVLGLLKGYGVTSIELGAQSMDDAVLTLNRRGHTAQAVEDAARLIRAGGFRLGLQMMVGLWGDTPAKAHETARRLSELRPDEVRIYPTVVLRGTALARAYEAGDYRPMGLGEGVPLCADLLRFFEEEQGIPVIRLGLHPSREVEEAMVAGCYHPALGELCEGHLFMESLARQAERLPPGPLELLVHPRSRSKAVGQGRRNLLRLEELGYQVTVVEDASLPPKTAILRQCLAGSQTEQKEDGHLCS